VLSSSVEKLINNSSNKEGVTTPLFVRLTFARCRTTFTIIQSPHTVEYSKVSSSKHRNATVYSDSSYPYIRYPKHALTFACPHFRAQTWYDSVATGTAHLHRCEHHSEHPKWRPHSASHSSSLETDNIPVRPQSREWRNIASTRSRTSSLSRTIAHGQLRCQNTDGPFRTFFSVFFPE